MDFIRKKLGFGCMRLPMDGEEVNLEEFSRMVDAFLAAGFHYFDTAHGYINGKSETALKQCLTSRHPRESYLLANKLSGPYFQKEEDIRPLFQCQLDACGVEYFDFYLMHAQNARNFLDFKRCRAYETAFALKEEGKVRHVGLSFHDKAEVLDQILTEYPQVEVVQLQLNYLDWDDPSVQSGQCWQVCRRHNKPVIVMEPCKGGSLAQPPEDAQAELDALRGGSPASYAIRFAAGQEGVLVVLSGMSGLAQIEDNMGFMQDFSPLNEEELAAVERARELTLRKNLIPCTSCRYCLEGCPQGIVIPELLACLNAAKSLQDWTSGERYKTLCSEHSAPASACVKCGRCETVCPQHLPIRELLERTAKVFGV